ncbi:protection of telomeres protein 1 isoform X2 [Nelusetta ayraudi]|uniref:protection of telomeres protein 1 isoform X2 n=1 Tax=Nelusetta ayraudi TaxID=303726 RepID=UPI003F7260FC
MPVSVLAEGAVPGAQVPSHLTRIPVAEISAGMDCSRKSVQGRVVSKGPLVSPGGDNFVLKTVLQDSHSDSSSINVVLLGALAKEFDRAVSQGDVVVASGFTVGSSPTHHKDQLHRCNLQLSGEHACLFVSRPPAPPTGATLKRHSAQSAEEALHQLPTQGSSRTRKTPKYTYTGLDQLKLGVVVNVYGVVVFCKQPFRSRGTDYCSTLKITDQSNQIVWCSIFCKNPVDHPVIFQVGDIIRLHRVKVKPFNESVSLVNTFGFSAVTVSCADDGPLEPRTTSGSFHWDQEDVRKVQELRGWAATGQAAVLPAAVPLSKVEPRSYFDLTCQLLAKAPLDATCTLLRVWDGTRCRHPLLEVWVEPGMMEAGPALEPRDAQGLVVNVLAYDNHVESARQLQPGDFLKIFNLRALPAASSKAEGLAGSQMKEADASHLTFHLHGGTAFGRGIRVLPKSSPDVQKLMRDMEPLLQRGEPSDEEVLEVWCTPPEFPAGAEQVQISSERRCSHDAQQVTLSELKHSSSGRFHHVRVQLKSFEPQRLHQALKLYCSKCCSMCDVPDEEQLAAVFAASSVKPGCSGPPWTCSGQADLPSGSPGSPARALSIHLSTQLVCEGKTKELLLLEGATLQETSHLASAYSNVIPVTSSGGHMTLLDLSAPFLFRGRKRFYGCRRCSSATLREPYVKGQDSIDEKSVSEVLGVELLQFVLLMKLQLQDATDTLEVFLWRDAELFFGVSAEEAATNQEAQDVVSQTMDSLCPPGGSADTQPWLQVCVASYLDGDGKRTCHQICHTSVVRAPSAGAALP